MDYVSIAAAAGRWGVSERSARNYCAQGRVPGAYLDGKTWMVPADAEKPDRKPRPARRNDLVSRLTAEMDAGIRNGIYRRLQVDIAYNSNHIEGSRLSEEQTSQIFETHTISPDGGDVSVDDIVETSNHFRCFDHILRTYGRKLSGSYIKNLHLMLKQGTTDLFVKGYVIGKAKKLPNTIGDLDTVPPGMVDSAMEDLLSEYESLETYSLDALLDFHVRFERIHPFQDGNGRVGRLLLFKECLRRGIVPFVISDRDKSFYYRGLREWDRDHAYLTDTCLSAQDEMKELLTFFRIDSE